MWPWANERHRHLVCFANPESPRVTALKAAFSGPTEASLEIVSWLDVLNGRWMPSRMDLPQTLFRLESPGKSWEVEQAILALGAGALDPEDPDATRWERMSLKAVTCLSEDRGRILPMRQWQLGWTALLQRVEALTGPEARWLCPPQDVLCMFDKSACQDRLERSGCPVPPALGIALHYDHLMELMDRAGCRRVFLKSCHGSSASGIVALETGAGGMQAFSTVALSGTTAAQRLHNSRRVIRYQGSESIRPLVDQVCRLRAMTQVWIPKAGWRGRRMDLRILVIDGQARHTVPRLSRTPFTTLQLGATRGDAAELRKEIGDLKWARAVSAAEAAARAFPDSLYAGMDVLITPGWSRAAVLEVNSFGDLLPGVFFDGQDTYRCELAAAGIL